MDVDPPALLKTSVPPELMVTVFVPPWMMSLMAIKDLSVGAVGKVMVIEPDVVLTGTKSCTAAV